MVNAEYHPNDAFLRSNKYQQTECRQQQSPQFRLFNCTILPANSLKQMIFVYGLVFGAAIYVGVVRKRKQKNKKQNNFINVRAFCRQHRKFYLTLLLSPI